MIGIFLIAAGWNMKIVVDEARISSSMFFWRKAIRWDDLDHSVIYVLLEPDHPFGIKLYGHQDRTARITIYLKNYAKSDVQWMLKELPLKIRATHGKMGSRGSMIEPKKSKLGSLIQFVVLLLLLFLLKRYFPNGHFAR